MNVYFTASITYKDKLGRIYERIVKKLESMGHKVEATHVLKHSVEKIMTHSDEQRFKDYEEMLSWIKNANIVVAEVSFPSTVTTGHVLTRALEQGKPVLALYKRGSVPPLLLGLELERFRLVEYDEHDLENVLEREINELMKLPDQRFTMLLPSDIASHLDEVAERGTTRSEYIRRLIKKDMNKKR